MSFLDNLENNLKALEGRETGGLDQSKRREADRQRAIASAPWAERLKTSEWTRSLMREATRAGFERHTKVNLTWVQMPSSQTALRLEARQQRLELEPLPSGIEVVFRHLDQELKRGLLTDLDASPQELVEEWMRQVDLQKKLDDAETARLATEAEIELDPGN